MHIFIDESGDFGAKGSRYFILGMVFYYGKDLSAIDSVIKKHNRHLWKNGWPRDTEVKATNLYNYKSKMYKIDCSKLTISPREQLQKIYKDLNLLDLKATFLIHDPANQGPVFSGLHDEKKYNFLSKVLYAKSINYLISPMEIYVDQRNITLVKKQTRVNLNTHRLCLDYIGYINNVIAFQFAKYRKIPPEFKIYFEKSQKIKGLQIVDYLNWAVTKKFEGRSHWDDLTPDIEKYEFKDNFK